MTIVDLETRSFEPGTTGWTADDLDDPQIEAQWADGRYEIVEGVLTRMAPAYFTGGSATFNLIRIVGEYFDRTGIKGSFAPELEIIAGRSRVLRADAAFMSLEDQHCQKEAAKALGRRDPRRSRILVPPMLVIESVSPGHEFHDKKNKLLWYAEFGVMNYWILDAFARTLECHRLGRDAYHLDVAGKEQEEVRPSAFSGLVIPLGRLWMEET